MIYENSSASTSSEATLQHGNKIGIEAAADAHSHQASLGSNVNFDGGGSVQRSGNLLAQITATVTGTAANGDLWISGQQIVTINAERQEIRVEGRVRLLDISEANTVPSNRIAEARISYLGDGDLAAHQRPSWLSRFFTWVGL
jgi:flagellar L-ring protein precursor FlgH